MDVEPVAENAPRCVLRVAAKDRSSWPPAAAMPALKWSDARRGPRSCTARDLLELEEREQDDRAVDEEVPLDGADEACRRRRGSRLVEKELVG